MDPRLELLRNASFPVASTGYQSNAVHRLLTDLRMRIQAGEPVADLLATDLSQVSFGYEVDAVDDLLDRLRRDPADVPPPAVAEGAGPGDTDGGADTSRVEPGPPLADDDPALRANFLQSLADEVERVRFPMTRRWDPGYRVDDVDAALDGFIEQLNSATLTAEHLQQARFNTTGTMESGYEVADVDDFLDRLADAITHNRSDLLQQASKARTRKGWLARLFGA